MRCDITVSDLQAKIEQLTKERDDLIAEAVKTLAITHAEQDEYENDLAAIKKERDELRAELELQSKAYGLLCAELKSWTDQEPVAYMYDWIDGNPLGECSIIKDWIDTVAKEPTAFNMRPLYAKPKEMK